MASRERIERVRSDLRALRRQTHAIETMTRVKELHEARIRELRAEPGCEEEIARLEGVIREIKLTEAIRRATEIEERYMRVISRMEPVDRVIILDGYVNGRPYWQIGQEIGYSEDGIKTRVRKIIARLADEA